MAMAALFLTASVMANDPPTPQNAAAHTPCGPDEIEVGAARCIRMAAPYGYWPAPQKADKKAEKQPQWFWPTHYHP